jgi:hypothetical protein
MKEYSLDNVGALPWGTHASRLPEDRSMMDGAYHTMHDA